MFEIIKENKEKVITTVTSIAILGILFFSLMQKIDEQNKQIEKLSKLATPTQIEVIKTNFDNYKNQRLEKKNLIENKIKEIEILNNDISIIESKIRCEQVNLTGTGGINCEKDFNTFQ